MTARDALALLDNLAAATPGTREQHTQALAAVRVLAELVEREEAGKPVAPPEPA